MANWRPDGSENERAKRRLKQIEEHAEKWGTRFCGSEEAGRREYEYQVLRAFINYERDVAYLKWCCDHAVSPGG